MLINETSLNMMVKARSIVVQYFNSHADITDIRTINLGNTYVVWFSKTLQNWKALVSTDVPDGMYYEITYNGDKKETYLDVYKKWENIVIPDDTYGNTSWYGSNG